jgi:hypothetical protein
MITDDFNPPVAIVDCFKSKLTKIDNFKRRQNQGVDLIIIVLSVLGQVSDKIYYIAGDLYIKIYSDRRFVRLG